MKTKNEKESVCFAAMGKRTALLAIVFLLALAPFGQVVARDNGMWNSSGGCGCHGGTGVTAQISGLPSAYVAATTYSLTVSMSTSPNTGGFNLEVNRGALSNPDANTQVSNNGFQATHDYSPGTTAWSMDWTAPASGSGTVHFDLAVLSANGNGGTSGDSYGSSSTSLIEDVPSNVAPTVTDVSVAPVNPITTDGLSVSYTYSDGDGDAESGTTVAWYRNGALQPDRTGLTLPAAATTKGDAWHAAVTPSDGTNTGSTVASSSVSVLNAAPTVTAVVPSSETPDTSEAVTFTFQTDDVDGDTVSQTDVRWRLDGTVVSSLDNVTTLPSVATRSGDVWEIELRVSDGTDLSAWLTSPAIVVGSSNQPPTVADVGFSSTTVPTTNDDVQATWTEADPDGDELVDLHIVWYLNGAAVSQADDLNPLPASLTEKGQTWVAEVRVSDGEAWSQWTSSDGITIGNAPPIATTVELRSPSSSALHDLVVDFTATDDDGDGVSFVEARWYLDNVLQTNVGNEDRLPAQHLARGDAWHAVVVLSDGTDASETASNTVVIGNAPPTISVSWPENATSLTDLTPVISVVDVDNDETVFTTTWYKNGFRDATLANATTVPVDKLAPEQTWRLVVDSTDGTDASPTLDTTVALVNLAPSPSVDVRSSSVWVGETTVLSADASSDLDGEILQYKWTWEGGFALGEQAEVVLLEDTLVTLTITDDHGASANVSLRLKPTPGPSMQNVAGIHDGKGQVSISWSWTSTPVSYNILRNGVLVGTTNDTSYTDRPLMSGINTYTLQPFDDERTFLKATGGVSVEVSGVEIEQPEPAQGLGYGLGGSLVLVLLLLQFLLVRKGGGRA